MLKKEHGFEAIGTTSFTVGVLVKANLGRLQDLVTVGVPVGMELADLEPVEKPQVFATSGKSPTFTMNR